LRPAVLLTLALAGPSAHATVAEQRARLPPPAECADEVEGFWRSHMFWAARQEWYLQTLEIRRVRAGAPDLTGTIIAEYWNGGSPDEQPPPCNPGRYHYVVRMPATGSVREGEIAFGSSTWSYDRILCGPGSSYNPDRFTGRIDPKLQEFQSLNNDGGAAVNLPTVFRRIRCFDGVDPEPAPSVVVRPPAFRPPRDRESCRCSVIGRGPPDSAPRGVVDGRAACFAGLCGLAVRRARGRRRPLLSRPRLAP
jgi:hypothetical protein